MRRTMVGRWMPAPLALGLILGPAPGLTMGLMLGPALGLTMGLMPEMTPGMTPGTTPGTTLALGAGVAPDTAQVLGWPALAPELVQQVDSLLSPAILNRSDRLVVDRDSFDQAQGVAALEWPATSPEGWRDRLGQEVHFEVPVTVSRPACQQQISCPYEGEPRVYRLVELGRTVPPALAEVLTELPEHHRLAVIRVEFNLGSPGERSWRRGYHEYTFVLDAGGDAGPRIASRVGMVRVATGGGELGQW
jgi:hypothetical protein